MSRKIVLILLLYCTAYGCVNDCSEFERAALIHDFQLNAYVNDDSASNQQINSGDSLALVIDINDFEWLKKSQHTISFNPFMQGVFATEPCPPSVGLMVHCDSIWITANNVFDGILPGNSLNSLFKSNWINHYKDDKQYSLEDLCDKLNSEFIQVGDGQTLNLTLKTIPPNQSPTNFTIHFLFEDQSRIEHATRTLQFQ